MAIDPVCKMEVDEKTTEYKSNFKGNIYYFCDAGCKEKFDKNPEKYVKKPEKKREMPPYGPC